MQITRRSLLATGVLAAGLSLPTISFARWDGPAAQPADTGESPPTLDELYAAAGLLDVALSPDGSRIAAARELHERVTDTSAKLENGAPKLTSKRTAYVALHKASDLDAQPGFVKVGDYDIESVEWASEDRLLIAVRMTKDEKGLPLGLMFGPYFIPLPVRRVISVGADGAAPVVLFGNQPKAMKREFDLGMIVDRLWRDPEHVLMQKWERSKSCYGLYRVSVRTGEATLVELGDRLTDTWLTQDGVPVLRFDSNYRGTTFSVYGRAPGEEKWKLVRKTRRNELKRFTGMDAVGMDKEPGVVLVSHRAEGEEFASVKAFDLRTLQFGKTLAAAPGADVNGAFIDEAGELIAYGVSEDRQDYRFKDAELAKHFNGVNGYYQGEANVRLFDASLDHKRFLFRVTGPRYPGQFVFYDVAAKHLNVLGDQYQHLRPGRLARMETLKVKTRDGQTITAFVSHPPGPSKGRPMVVMPHGGPEVRDHYEYHPWVQYLCAQGWLVLQPNFRGSGGLGRTFAVAGHRQWGARMQEDVEDAVAQVVASGAADPKILAIFGASYGGYAAAMGVIRKPGLYRCAVCIAGDFDLKQSLEHTRKEDGADSETYAYWSASMGDLKADAELLRNHSPRQRVAEIAVPLQLWHGSEDAIVTVEQSRQMAKALKKAGKVHEYVEFPGEGHSGWSTGNEKRMLRESVAFIKKAFAAA